MYKPIYLSIFCILLFFNLPQKLQTHPAHTIRSHDAEPNEPIFNKALPTRIPPRATAPQQDFTQPPFAPFTTRTIFYNTRPSWTPGNQPVTATRPQSIFTRPQFSTAYQPQTSTVRPVTTTGPQLIFTRPQFSTAFQPQTSTVRPVTTTGPQLIFTRPQFSTAYQPQKSTVRPVITTTGPRNPTTEKPLEIIHKLNNTQPNLNKKTISFEGKQSISNYSNPWTSTWSYPQWNASSTGWWYYNESSSTWSSPAWYDNYTTTWSYPQWNASSTGWWYYNQSSSTSIYPQWNMTETSASTSTLKGGAKLGVNVNIDIRLNGEVLRNIMKEYNVNRKK